MKYSLSVNNAAFVYPTTVALLIIKEHYSGVFLHGGDTLYAVSCRPLFKRGVFDLGLYSAVNYFSRHCPKNNLMQVGRYFEIAASK